MRTIGKLTSLEGKICVYLASQALGERFLKDAEAEGFVFVDGAKPTEKKWESVIIVGKDWTLRYLVGFAGHMAFKQPQAVIGEPWVRIDYRKYIAGEDDFFYKEERVFDPFEDEFHVRELKDITASDEDGNLHSGEACFLVKGNDIKDMFSPFWEWLRKQGFRSCVRHGHYPHVGWVFS